jgi:hypothetical protein
MRSFEVFEVLLDDVTRSPREAPYGVIEMLLYRYVRRFSVLQAAAEQFHPKTVLAIETLKRQLEMTDVHQTTLVQDEHIHHAICTILYQLLHAQIHI